MIELSRYLTLLIGHNKCLQCCEDTNNEERNIDDSTAMTM